MPYHLSHTAGQAARCAAAIRYARETVAGILKGDAALAAAFEDHSRVYRLAEVLDVLEELAGDFRLVEAQDAALYRAEMAALGIHDADAAYHDRVTA